MILFEVVDEEDWPIEEIDFPDVYQGQPTSVQILRVVNTGNEDLEKVSIRAVLSTSQQGNRYDTINAHFFSLNGMDFTGNVNFPLKVDEEKRVYTYYRPPSTTRPGNVEWAMEIIGTPATGP
jgi:hypothetical protein